MTLTRAYGSGFALGAYAAYEPLSRGNVLKGLTFAVEYDDMSGGWVSGGRAVAVLLPPHVVGASPAYALCGPAVALPRRLFHVSSFGIPSMRACLCALQASTGSSTASSRGCRWRALPTST